MATEKADNEPLTFDADFSMVDRKHKVGFKSWSEFPRWVHVFSTNVKAIKYDAKKEELQVEFRNKSIYAYEGVHLDIAREMFHASSMGKFIWQRLRAGNFTYRKLK